MDAENIDLREKQITTKTVYQGRLLHVKEDQVALPNGECSVREYIVHPGAVVILPLFDNGDLLLERQFRYPLDRDFLEFPAGKIDQGEEIMDCAQRELQEETGYTAQSWQYLTTIYPCIGYSNERLIYFVARNLVLGGSKPDDDEFLEIVRMPFEVALEKVRTGEICEVKTIAGIFWLEKLHKGEWSAP